MVHPSPDRQVYSTPGGYNLRGVTLDDDQSSRCRNGCQVPDRDQSTLAGNQQEMPKNKVFSANAPVAQLDSASVFGSKTGFPAKSRKMPFRSAKYGLF
jgi:hypothetical protein